MGASIEAINTQQLLAVSESLGANEVYTSAFLYSAQFSHLIAFVQSEAASQTEGVAVEFSNDKSTIFRTYTATMDGSRNPLAIFVYDYSEDTYTDNTLMESAFAVAPFESNTVDYTFLGYAVKFKGLTVTLDSAAVYDLDLEFQYWDGSAWSTLTVTDGTSEFTTSGDITFTIPSDWQRTTVNDTLGFFIRFHASSISSFSSAPTITSIAMISDEFDVVQIENLASWVRFIFENGDTAQDITIILNGRRV